MFESLTDEQVREIERMLKEAYEEGYVDAEVYWTKSGVEIDWEFSLAKNQSCRLIASKFMKPVKEKRYDTM